jgi:hypothetical protein
VSKHTYRLSCGVTVAFEAAASDPADLAAAAPLAASTDFTDPAADAPSDTADLAAALAALSAFFEPSFFLPFFSPLPFVPLPLLPAAAV